jgi:hypothetical protein
MGHSLSVTLTAGDSSTKDTCLRQCQRTKVHIVSSSIRQQNTVQVTLRPVHYIFVFINPPITPLRSLINLINQLNTTNLTLPQLIQPLQHALKPARTNLGRVNSELLAREQLRSKLPERLAELKVLRLCGHVHAAEELEGFAGDGVAEGCLGRRKRYVLVGGGRALLFFNKWTGVCSPCSQHQCGHA